MLRSTLVLARRLFLLSPAVTITFSLPNSSRPSSPTLHLVLSSSAISLALFFRLRVSRTCRLFSFLPVSSSDLCSTSRHLDNITHLLYWLVYYHVRLSISWFLLPGFAGIQLHSSVSLINHVIHRMIHNRRGPLTTQTDTKRGRRKDGYGIELKAWQRVFDLTKDE